MILLLAYCWLISILCNAEIFERLTKSLIIDAEVTYGNIFALKVNQSNYDEVLLLHPRVKELTVEMQVQMSNVTTFRVKDGSVKIVHLLADLKAIQVYNCSTSEVVIHPRLSYQTEDMAVVFNNLVKLPQHLSVLKRLKNLNLHDNQIEFIDMVEFNGLENLKYIALQSNNIYEISGRNPVLLPKLEIFYAHQNHIVDLSFEHWNATSLHTIYLHENRLQIIPLFPIAFPALKTVAIDSNPFNCRWLAATLMDLKEANVTVWDADKTTCNKAGPPLEALAYKLKLPEMVEQLRESQVELETSFKDKLKHLESINGNLNETVERLQKENKKINNQNKMMKARLRKCKTKQLQRENTDFQHEFGKIVGLVSSKLDLVLNVTQQLQVQVGDLAEQMNSHVDEANESSSETEENNKFVEESSKKLLKTDDID